MRNLLLTVMFCVIPVAGVSQNLASSDSNSKLRFHVESAFGPRSILGSAASAGFLQKIDSPAEWGQGGRGYGRRFASAVSSSGIRSVLAFGLDSALSQDPRYFRSDSTGFWRRAGHALRGTILTRTDAGRETLSTWRLGSAYGAAFISNQWYPDRPGSVVRRGLAGGSARLGFDVVGNLGSEFWPDIKRKILRRKP